MVTDHQCLHASCNGEFMYVIVTIKCDLKSFLCSIMYHKRYLVPGNEVVKVMFSVKSVYLPFCPQ